jgi:hypothetical protein
MTITKKRGADMKIQTTIKNLPEKIRQISQLQMPPNTSVWLIIDDKSMKELKENDEKPEKSRWVKIAERISRESPLDEEAGEELRRLSREFRENFRFREPPHFEHIEDD